MSDYIPGGMARNFVTFLSPGTFVAETTTQSIDTWDVDKAVEMSRSIKERHGALPYGFYFTTRARDHGDLDSHQVKRSGTYYLGGKVETLEEIEARNDPKESILRSNMRSNKWGRVITNNNSWRWTQPLGPDDVVLESP